MTTGSGTVAAEADALAATVAACPAVASLSAGRLGQLVTLLPGRRVEGVRLSADRVQVGVVAAYGTPVALLAAQVRTALTPLVGARPVDVHVTDVAFPDDLPPALPVAPPAHRPVPR
ncbi:hypothetical protein ACWKWC_02325 [Geodermatophilus nigrescens]